MSIALTAHFASTWMLVGLIWIVQVLVYPQFRRVPPAEFGDYHMAHCWRIGFLVAPLLAVESLSAGWLLLHGRHEWSFLLSIGLIPVIWLSTALLQAPLHTRLMAGFDAEIVRKLILSNWVRTIAWTARGVLLGFAFAA
jgi:hypothetical protein